jgi:hypothetical protein
MQGFLISCLFGGGAYMKTMSKTSCHGASTKSLPKTSERGGYMKPLPKTSSRGAYAKTLLKPFTPWRIHENLGARRIHETTAENFVPRRIDENSVENFGARSTHENPAENFGPLRIHETNAENLGAQRRHENPAENFIPRRIRKNPAENLGPWRMHETTTEKVPAAVQHSMSLMGKCHRGAVRVAFCFITSGSTQIRGARFRLDLRE